MTDFFKPADIFHHIVRYSNMFPVRIINSKNDVIAYGKAGSLELATDDLRQTNMEFSAGTIHGKFYGGNQPNTDLGLMYVASRDLESAIRNLETLKTKGNPIARKLIHKYVAHKAPDNNLVIIGELEMPMGLIDEFIMWHYQG